MAKFWSRLPLVAASLVLFALQGVERVAAGENETAAFEPSQKQFDRTVKPFVARYCVACHDEKHAEKDLDLQTISPHMEGLANAARWASIYTQLTLRRMPPKQERQPDQEEVLKVTAWIEAEMKRSGNPLKVTVAQRHGNALDHELLFEGKSAARLEVAARARPLSAEIYAAFGREMGADLELSQPFLPEGRMAFQGAVASRLDEPTTSQLISNAQRMVERWTAHKMIQGVATPERGAPRPLVRLMDETNPASPAEEEAAIKCLFELALRRRPTAEELARFVDLLRRNIASTGRVTGSRFALAAVLLLPEAVIRLERGEGKPDEKGRVRLTSREIAFALAYALADRRPDAWLLAEAEAGKLDSQHGVEAAVHAMLSDPKLEKTRIKRFFREYFGYPGAPEVFKEPDDNPHHFPNELAADTDRLVAWILERDQKVLHELLTTNKSFVNFRWDARKQRGVKAREAQVQLAYGLPPDWNWTADQPIELPANERAGILTQPSWLVSVSKSDDNDAIRRGKWIRERLLGNVVPDVPITVDAQLPIAPEKTLRERMRVTQAESCWQCHRLMNGLGLPFEMYDHYGRFRDQERVVDREATAGNVNARGKSLGRVWREVPVDAHGGIEFVKEEALQGDVDGAVELMHKLASSPRVEQVFVRYAFRYWMDRNETPGDAPTLQAALAAYRESGGSMRALVAALLTSESFLYRAANGRLAPAETKTARGD